MNTPQQLAFSSYYEMSKVQETLLKSVPGVVIVVCIKDASYKMDITGLLTNS